MPAEDAALHWIWFKIHDRFLIFCKVTLVNKVNKHAFLISGHLWIYGTINLGLVILTSVWQVCN